jgi:hypothetical protein
MELFPCFDIDVYLIMIALKGVENMDYARN